MPISHTFLGHQNLFHTLGRKRNRNGSKNKEYLCKRKNGVCKTGLWPAEIHVVPPSNLQKYGNRGRQYLKVSSGAWTGRLWNRKSHGECPRVVVHSARTRVAAKWTDPKICLASGRLHGVPTAQQLRDPHGICFLVFFFYFIFFTSPGKPFTGFHPDTFFCRIGDYNVPA